MNLKTTAASLLALFAISSCSSHQTDSQQPNFTVILPASQADNGKMAYLTDFDSEAKVDSVIVTDGKAAFTGYVDKPYIARILIEGSRRGLLVVEAGEISVDTLSRFATGSPLNLALTSHIAARDSLAHICDTLAARRYHYADSVFRPLMAEARANLSTRIDSAITTHISDPLGEYFLLQEAYEMTSSQLDSMLGAYPSINRGIRLTRLIEAHKLKERTSPGNRFVDFEVAGDTAVVKLSDYVGRGKYTLVDFWASWCGPCRREAATLKQIYSQWADKGLEIVGVAVWDEPQATLAAIDQLDLPWPNILNTQRVATDAYGISSIPSIILFDPEGIIVARDIYGATLERAVAKAMTSYIQNTQQKSATSEQSN